MLTVKEAARKVGAADRTVRQWLQAGRLKGAVLTSAPSGSYWLIPESALDGIQARPRGRPPKSQSQKDRNRVSAKGK